jgi:hypothetical protein
VEKKDPKRSRSEYAPLAEAKPLGGRRSIPGISSEPSSGGSVAEEEVVDSDTSTLVEDNVFPHDQSIAKLSVGSEEEDQLFELALTADPEKALEMAESDEQKKKAWAAVKAKRAEVSSITD